MIQRGTHSLINPGAIFLCKKNLSLGEQEIIGGTEDYFISYKLSSDKFVGWIGDFAEYKSMHFPDKVYYNNIPRLELLNESEQDSIGYDQSTLERIEKSAVFTNIEPSIEHPRKTLNRFLPKYFGTAIDKGNTVLMFIIPPGYKSAYIFNGGSISSIYSYYRTNIIEKAESSYVSPFPRKLSIGNNNMPISDYPKDFTELDEYQLINVFSEYNDYIINNSALSLESDNEAELNYYRLVKVVIIPSKDTEETEISVNFVNLGYRTSENPYRNLDKYLLREEGFVQKYEFNSDNSVGHDLTSGTCIPGERTLSLGFLDTWTSYWRSIDLINYDPAEPRIFSYGDFISVGSSKRLWKYIGQYESQSKPGSWSLVQEGSFNSDLFMGYWQFSTTYDSGNVVEYDSKYWQSNIANNTENYPGAWKNLYCTENSVAVLHSTDVDEYNFSEGTIVKYNGFYWEAKKKVKGNIIPTIYQKDLTYYSKTGGIKHYYYKFPYKKNDLVILNDDIWLSLIDNNKENLPGFSTAWKKKPIYNFMDVVKITLITSSGETWTTLGKILSVDFYYSGIRITEMLELSGLGSWPYPSDSNITLVELNDASFVYQETMQHDQYNYRTVRYIFSRTNGLRRKLSSLSTITFKITST